MSYTKLHSEILDSTIWLEDLPVKVVWITMLAMRDERQEVQASLPNLARRAGVSLEDCKSSIDKFLSPDPHSRSQDFEGRRIEKVRGGWRILNGDFYQKRQSAQEKRAYDRLYRENKRLQEKLSKVTVENNDINNINSLDQKVVESRKFREKTKSRVVEKSRVDNIYTSQTTYTVNEDLNKVFEKYLKTFSKKKTFELSPKRKKAISQSLKQFGLAKCLAAIDNFYNDPWPERRKGRNSDIYHCFKPDARYDWCEGNKSSGLRMQPDDFDENGNVKPESQEKFDAILKARKA